MAWCGVAPYTSALLDLLAPVFCACIPFLPPFLLSSQLFPAHHAPLRPFSFLCSYSPSRPSCPADPPQAPYLFSTVWSLIKPWLDEATVRKIHILGKNYKQELQQYITPENLPKDLGGTCACAGGCSLSDAGPWNKVAQA